MIQTGDYRRDHPECAVALVKKLSKYKCVNVRGFYRFAIGDVHVDIPIDPDTIFSIWDRNWNRISFDMLVEIYEV